LLEELLAQEVDVEAKVLRRRCSFISGQGLAWSACWRRFAMAKARSYGYTVENKLNSRVSQYWPYGETLYGNDPSGRRVMKLTNPDPNNYAGEDDLLWEFYLYITRSTANGW
jgi:hypothetical protein